MRKCSIVAALIGGLCLSALTMSCSMREGTVQLEEIAYLSFVGDPSGLRLQIDEGEPQALMDSGREVRYEVPPGTHRVRVWRGEQAVVDRQVFLSRGQIFRVTLP